MDGKSCTCRAPVNIAVIKYWGKRDEKLILPVNPSLSATLGLDELYAKTTATVSSKFTEDKLWLNGKEQPINSPRIQNILKEIRDCYNKQHQGGGNETDLKIHICSENNFPTAAGLASSAAGYACMVYTLAQLYGVKCELSRIARKGSGSACRSVYGGFVLWEMGKRADGEDSVARPICDATHWPDMRILILVVSDQKKQIGSTEGMQTSLTTSELMNHRIKVVPRRTEDMIKAIESKDFPAFAELTMKESNQLHSVCLDTFPPIFYMTDTSRLIIQMVHAYNALCKETKVAYTFDAGPNACLYMMKEDVAKVIGLVDHFFPPASFDMPEPFHRGTPDGNPVTPVPPSQEELSAFHIPRSEGAIKYTIYTRVGSGPERLKDEESLLTPDGLPKCLV